MSRQLEGVLLTIKKSGLLPCVRAEGTAAQMSALAKAVWDAGVSALELIYDEGAPELLQAVKAGAGGLAAGVSNIRCAQQAADCIRAGAAWIAACGVYPDVMQACAEAGIPCVPQCSSAAEISQACMYQVNAVRYAGGREELKRLSALYPDVNYIVCGEAGMEEIHRVLDLPKVLAVDSEALISRVRILLEEWAQIRGELNRTMLDMLDFGLGHVGLNGKDGVGKTYADDLEFLFGFRQYPSPVNIFSDEKFEILTLTDKGTNGHIQILCSSVERATHYLRRKGVEFEPTIKYLPVESRSPVVEHTLTWELEESLGDQEFGACNPGKAAFLRYLAKETGRLAVHLGRRFYD